MKLDSWVSLGLKFCQKNTGVGEDENEGSLGVVFILGHEILD